MWTSRRDIYDKLDESSDTNSGLWLLAEGFVVLGGLAKDMLPVLELARG